MKYILFLFNLVLVLNIDAQNENKFYVWHTTETVDSVETNYLFIMFNGYFIKSRYRIDNGGFINTKGGKYIQIRDSIRFFYEFDSSDKEKASAITTYYYKEQEDKLILRSKRKSRELKQIDVGQPTTLSGVYLFSGSIKAGIESYRSPEEPRKTMKILTGNHFQWVAYNTDTKEFLGTGGGQYTAKDGKYIEHIRFFSKNNSKIGTILPFDYKVEGDTWHHSGLNSLGLPIEERWTKRIN